MQWDARSALAMRAASRAWPLCVRASPRIEAIHQHMVEARTVAAGHDLHSSKAVALEKAEKAIWDSAVEMGLISVKSA